MKKETKEFIRMLMMTQDELFKYVLEQLVALEMDFDYDLGNYILVKTTPLATKALLTSHLDTVDDNAKIRKNPQVVIENGVISVKEGTNTCLGGDDRAGVWIMLQLLRSPQALDYDYVFCCDEEVGGHGSTAFAKEYKELINEYNAIISLDRAGVDDCATYGYNNDELIKVFNKVGFKEEWGSFTDCVNMSAVSDVACVNLSVGYFSEHSSRETQNISVMYNTLAIMQRAEIIDALTTQRYEHDGYAFSGGWGGNYSWEQEYGDTHTASATQQGLDPIFCECCGQHLPLYNVKTYDDEEYSLCFDCVDLYDDYRKEY